MTTQPYDFSSALRLLWATLDIDGGELAARFGVSRRALDYWLSRRGLPRSWTLYRAMLKTTDPAVSAFCRNATQQMMPDLFPRSNNL